MVRALGYENSLRDLEDPLTLLDREIKDKDYEKINWFVQIWSVFMSFFTKKPNKRELQEQEMLEDWETQAHLYIEREKLLENSSSLSRKRNYFVGKALRNAKARRRKK